jgi:hypothetical protein
MCGAASVPDMSVPHWRIRQSVLPDPLFKEGLIYEQSATRTVREQPEKQAYVCTRQPLKIEQLRHTGRWEAMESARAARVL